MQQISYGKQRETQNSTPEIKVVTIAILKPPNASKETGEELRRHE
jgi:hypothetical protein